MPGKDDLRLQLRHPGRRIIEVADFEPEQHPIAVGKRGIADRTVVMLDVPAMQLEEQAIVLDEALVLRATVAAPAPQKTLVPTATCLDITDADQGLWTHTNSVASPGLQRQRRRQAHAPASPEEHSGTRRWKCAKTMSQESS